MKTSTIRLSLSILGMALFFQSCAPVFSELQSARTVGKGRLEVTPYASRFYYSHRYGKGAYDPQLGLQGAYGLSSRVDLRFRYEPGFRYVPGKRIGIMGIGPKFSLVQDKIALYLPFGRAIGEGTQQTWQMHPTLLLTVPVVKNKIDLTLSPKYLIALNEGWDNQVAANVGLAVSKDVTRWAIRTEYGLLYNPSVSGHFSQFSLGFSLGIGK